MHASISLTLWAGVSLVLFYTASLVYTSFRRRAKAKELGCEPPVTWRGGGFLGINLLRRMMKADKAGKFTNFMVDRYNELSAEIGRPATTFQFTLFGITNIHTTDPKNIQALLATQFPEYGLGPERRNNMIALLGDGIVSICYNHILAALSLTWRYSSSRTVNRGNTLELCSE